MAEKLVVGFMEVADSQRQLEIALTLPIPPKILGLAHRVATQSTLAEMPKCRNAEILVEEVSLSLSARWADVRFLQLVRLELSSLIVLTLVFIRTFFFDVAQSGICEHGGILIFWSEV